MGTAKDEIKGSAPKRKAKNPKAENILETVRQLKDDLSELAALKDEEAEKEGEAMKVENQMKAMRLRMCHTCATMLVSLLEDY